MLGLDERVRVAARRFSVNDETPPRAFLAALVSLLPVSAWREDGDSLETEDPLEMFLTSCTRPSTTRQTTWETTGVVEGLLIRVTCTAQDPYWAYDHHRDGALELTGWEAWARPVAQIVALELASAELRTPSNAGMFTSVQWVVHFPDTEVRLPPEGTASSRDDELVASIMDHLRSGRQ